MQRRITPWLLMIVLVVTLLAGCAKPEAPPPPPEPPPIPEPTLPAALGVPDLAQARPLVLEPANVPASDGPPLDLSEVAFVTAERGFGVGFYGAIYRTDDGGRTWRQVSQHDSIRFIRLQFVGERVAWAVGYYGCGAQGEGCTTPAVARTTDGGETWEAVEASGLPAADAPGAWGMHLIPLTADVAYAAMPGPPLLRTTDGGRTWLPMALPEGLISAGGIHFLSPEKGYVSASRGPKRQSIVLATEDGGQTWRTIYEGTVPIRAIQFLDEKRGFIGGGFGHYREGALSRILLATEDGGATWEERSREERFFREAAPFTQFYFTSPTTGWAEQEHGPAVFTIDGGRSWAPVMPDRFLARPSILGDRIWARWGAIDHGYLYHTADGGQTWGTLYQRGALVPWRIQFISPEVGWLATEPGLLKTTDGGESWTQTGILTPTMPMQIPIFVTDQVALRYAEERRAMKGTLERSEDGGRTWSEVLAGVATPWLSFPTPTTGYLVSRNNKTGPGSPYPDFLMKSVDGGRTWTKLRTPMPLSSQVAFADEKNGAVAGGYIGERKLMVTGDGGESWLSVSLPDIWIRSISYTRGGHLWLAVAEEGDERRGLLLHSPDRGATWEVFEVKGAGEGVNQVHFTSPTDGWLVARLGKGPGDAEPVLARTRDGGKTWESVWP